MLLPQPLSPNDGKISGPPSPALISGELYYGKVHQVFKSLCHVENVTLSNWCIKFLYQMKNNGMAVHFPNAKFLKLYTAGKINEMLDALEMFPNLMILIAKLNQFPQQDGCLTPKTSASLHHLKRVEITWDLEYPAVFQLVEILLENADMLEKMVLRLRNCMDNPDEFILALEKVQSMPRSSPHAEVITSRDSFSSIAYTGLF